MKKFARVLALIMVFAMMLSMTAFAANDKTTWIRVSIEDDEGGANGKSYRVYHWDDSSRYLTEESPLLVEVVSIINKMYDPADKTTRLWDFESKGMKAIMDKGLTAYAKSESAWQNYVDQYFDDVNPVAGMQSLKAILRDTDAVVGDLEPNVAHMISFKNEVKGDSKYGVTYTVTVTRYADVAPALNIGANGDDGHHAYINGYPDGTIRPNGNITRAEAASILYRVMTPESREIFKANEVNFTDVADNAWYIDAVAAMAAAGIITGYPDGSFRPDAPITRAEIAAMVVRFTEEGRNLMGAEYRGVYADVAEGAWYAPAVELANKLGWLLGFEGNYRPADNMTRAEFMTMVNRILECQVKVEGMLDGMKTWPDNQPGTWYYTEVQSATNGHTFGHTNEQVAGQNYNYEFWTGLIK
ncbi:MAG: S-layer homology domain-containing protein [Clostridia bacterium]|nr:S-layer homology domain-containing protein [Clostridia bacterium]